MQTELLRVLQPPPGTGPCHREFFPVGGSKLVVSDVRIVAATNRDLVQEIKANRFREDFSTGLRDHSPATAASGAAPGHRTPD